MRTFIGFVLHTFGIQHQLCDIISGVYHKHVTFICAVCHQQLGDDITVRLVTAFALACLDYWNVILVGLLMSSPYQCHCSESFMWQHILCWTWSRLIMSSVLHFELCLLLHNSLVSGICHSCWRQSLTFRRAQLFNRWEIVTSTFHDRDERSAIELFALLHC